jgi:dipeptidyl aminopeptidase/acylaminoacyl peptidase
MRLVAVVAFAAALAACWLCATAGGSAANGPVGLGSYVDPAWSPDGKSIAFVDNSFPDGSAATDGDLYVMKADGTNPRKLTNSPGGGKVPSPRGPSWSPDSKKIVFAYGPNGIYGAHGIYVVNANGAGLHKLVGAGASYPAWSPSGRKIAFALGKEPELLRIYAVNPDGTNRALVAAEQGEHACSLVWPTWSPDGQRIAFGNAGPECSNTMGMVTRYRGPIRTLAYDLIGAQPDWSPGGRRIVYSTYDTLSGDRRIVVLELKTGRRKFLHTGTHPSWSPNSRRIVFSDKGAIYVMSADGTEVSKLYPR